MHVSKGRYCISNQNTFKNCARRFHLLAKAKSDMKAEFERQKSLTKVKLVATAFLQQAQAEFTYCNGTILRRKVEIC
jgi:hypothetical protein